MLQRSILSRTVLRCRSGASLRRGFQLQADVPEGAPPIRGLDVISNRIANIVINITEKRPTNILHVYPENSVVTYLGKSLHKANYLAMTSLQNSSALKPPFIEQNKYTSQHTLQSFSNISREDLPFDYDSFSVTIHALPMYRNTEEGNETNEESESLSSTTLSSPTPINVEEIIRSTAPTGYALLGYPEVLWEKYSIQSTAQEMKQGKLMVLMKVALPICDIPMLPNSSDSTPATEMEVFEAPLNKEIIRMGDYLKDADNQTNKRLSVRYCIGVYRRF